MNIQRWLKKQQINLPIDTVSEAEQFDTVWFEKSEIEDAKLVDSVNALLAKKELALVLAKTPATSGNFRCWIGEKNYVRHTTRVE